jgi:hypothetical protein
VTDHLLVPCEVADSLPFVSNVVGYVIRLYPQGLHNDFYLGERGAELCTS